MIATFSERHKKLKQAVEKVVKERVVPRAAEIDTTDEYPHDLRKLFAQLGYFGILAPKEYGGEGSDITSACIVTEEIAKVSASCAQMTYSGIQACCMLLFCNEEQRRRVYPSIVTGEKIIGFSVTEPTAGSDIGRIETTAVRQGNHYVLNGTKVFASGVGFWNSWFMMAKTDPTAGTWGLALFLVDEDIPGLHFGHLDDRLGLRGAGGGEIILDNAIVPRENLIGGEGEGRKIIRPYLPLARIGHAAVAQGIAGGALDCTIDYLKSKVQPQKSEETFHIIANMVTTVEAAHSLLYSVAALADQDYTEPSLTKYASMAKSFCGDAAMSTTTDAVQLLGGDGYTKEFPAERMMRDAKAYQILEGTHQIQWLVIARSVLGI